MEIEPRIVPECQLCKPHNRSDSIKHSTSLLSQSAKRGCYSCGILKACIRGLVESSYEVRQQSGSDWSDPFLSVTLYLPDKYNRMIPYMDVCQISENYQGDQPYWISMPDCDSDDNLAWIKQQLNSCAKNHNCNTSLQSYFPTRVLDIGLNNDTTHVKVVKHPEGDERKYLTLSHCWGDPTDMTTKLTVHTQNEYMASGIPIESLPQTFKDAVQFTRTMGIRYLWIDSLCVIQRDSEKDGESDKVIAEEDWKSESGKMCSIYQNSHLTLAAVWGRGCRDGFFYEPKIFKLQRQMPDGYSSVFARREVDRRDDIWRLFDRGWAFQERLLSPRTIYFCGYELLWRCKERSVRNDKEDSSVKSGLPILPNHGQWTPQLNWHYLVGEYTTTKLTYECDKLAAIEGLAQYLAQYFYPPGSQEYLAGLWKHSFWEDFMWLNLDPLKERRTEQVEPPPIKNRWSSEERLFPTWSWASSIGRIHWHYEVSKISADAVLAKWELTDAPHKLLLEGTVVPIGLRKLLQYGFRHHKKGPYNADDYFHMDYDFTRQGKGHINEDATVYCLRLFEQRGNLKSVVLHCVDAINQIYERIGIVYFKEVSYRKTGRLPEWWAGVDIPECRKISLV
ncbi:heterokaryon incompatibility protein-domain-containing protein [Hypoxylon cercidicola]|nr:heterokaryon incompatibility protein-domain-containing protein [Hypoxylon cercidicola]